MSAAASSITINWPKVLARCRPEVHKKIMEARGRHEELRRLIAEAKAHTPSINFEAYRKALPASAHGFLQEMEAVAGSFKLNKIDTAPLLQTLEAERNAKMVEAEAFLVRLEEGISELKAKLGRLQAAKPVEELSIDDVYEMKPELREKFLTAMKNDNWSTEDEGPEEAKRSEAAGHH